jgi:hypothetical protein
MVCLEFSTVWLYVGSIFALRYYEPHTNVGRLLVWTAALSPALFLFARARARDSIGRQPESETN